MNPILPLLLILKRQNNSDASLHQACKTTSTYTQSFLLSRQWATLTHTWLLGNQYNYDVLKIGLVLISYGAGCVLGSVLGGRWSDQVLSDQVLRHLTDANDGHHFLEACLSPVVALQAVLNNQMSA